MAECRTIANWQISQPTSQLAVFSCPVLLLAGTLLLLFALFYFFPSVFCKFMFHEVTERGAGH